MKPFWSFLYSFIAGISDFYFLSFALGAITALGGCVFQSPVPLFLLILIFVVSLLVAILYHAIFARRVSWLTPGEQLVGRVVEQSKEWKNPYGRNRWALFIVILITIMLAGNAWDSLSLGLTYTFDAIAARVILLTALYYGLVQLGRGQLGGLLYVVAFFAILVLVFLRTLAFDPQVQQVMVLTCIVAIAIHAIIATAYHFLRRTGSKQTLEQTAEIIKVS